MFNKTLIILTIALLSACMSLPGDVSYSESKVDGVKRLSTDPGWCGPNLKLGLFKTSKMNNDTLIVDVVVIDTVRINDKDSLTVRVDDKFQIFNPIDGEVTEHQWVAGDQNTPGHSESTRRFEVPHSFIKSMIDGKSVFIKVSCNGNTMAEGEFSIGGWMSAKSGFRKFYKDLHRLDERNIASEHK